MSSSLKVYTLQVWAKTEEHESFGEKKDAKDKLVREWADYIPYYSMTGYSDVMIIGLFTEPLTYGGSFLSPLDTLPSCKSIKRLQVGREETELIILNMDSLEMKIR